MGTMILINLYMAAGIIWIEGSTYVGRASDGAVVQLGSIHELGRVVDYVNQHPGPEWW